MNAGARVVVERGMFIVRFNSFWNGMILYFERGYNRLGLSIGLAK